MSEYSVEEVREWKGIAESNANLYAKMTGAHEPWTKLADMLADLLERIKADEGAVPVAFAEVDSAGSVQSVTFHKDADNNQPLYLHPPAQATQVDQYGWLIENGKNVPDLRYRCMRQGCIEWTADHNEALRFARRADAESFAEEDEDAWRIVEHGWHAPTALPVAQLECPKCHGTGEVSDCDGLYAGQCTACRAAGERT